MRGYLRLAARYDDPRLLESALRVLATHGPGASRYGARVPPCRSSAPRTVHRSAREAPADPEPRSEDERRTERTCPCSPKVFGPELLPALLDALATHADLRVRDGAAFALGVLAAAGRPEEEVGPVRDRVVTALLAILETGPAPLQEPCARALAAVIFHEGDPRGILDRRAAPSCRLASRRRTTRATG